MNRLSDLLKSARTDFVANPERSLETRYKAVPIAEDLKMEGLPSVDKTTRLDWAKEASAARRSVGIETIKEAIGQLGADSFSTRQAATNRLLTLPPEAIPQADLLLGKLTGQDREIKSRASEIRDRFRHRLPLMTAGDLNDAIEQAFRKAPEVRALEGVFQDALALYSSKVFPSDSPDADPLASREAFAQTFTSRGYSVSKIPGEDFPMVVLQKNGHEFFFEFAQDGYRVGALSKIRPDLHGYFPLNQCEELKNCKNDAGLFEPRRFRNGNLVHEMFRDVGICPSVHLSCKGERPRFSIDSAICDEHIFYATRPGNTLIPWDAVMCYGDDRFIRMGVTRSDLEDLKYSRGSAPSSEK